MANTVFYSWQSALPSNTNRGFIQKALEDACKTLGEDGTVQMDFVMDRDTAGVPGSPDICSTILGKIDQALVFVCDVSIINQEAPKNRLTPNPNVLFELGYAFKARGPDGIIMVMNTAFGNVEDLPFDIRHRLVLTYNAPSAESERAPERRKLQGVLEHYLRCILNAPMKKPEPGIQEVEIPVAGRWKGRNDRPGEQYGDRRQGQLTPATVEIKPGQVYKFWADFGLADAGLENLARLADNASVQSLSLFRCKHLTEPALCTLQAFRYIWDLDLAETNATDRVLDSLRRLTSLRQLNLTGCNVSAAALEQIRAALPNCKIVAGC